MPKSKQIRCSDSLSTKLNVHSPIPTSFSHVTATALGHYQYNIILFDCRLQCVDMSCLRCHTFCNLFTLQLTCEKDVGMGLCTFNFVLRLSLHLVCLLFGTTSFEFFLIFLLLYVIFWVVIV